MFAAPPDVQTVVHARLPEEFRCQGRATDWIRVRPQYKSIDSFLEGPCFDRAGNLHVVSIPFGQVFTLSPNGDWKMTLEYDGEPNGLAIHPDGRFFLADAKWGIMVADPVSGKVEPFVNRVGTERFKGCNDLVFARNGDLYFTDQGQTALNDPTGRVFRLRTNGKLECLLWNVPSPNGIGLAPDESTLFVAATRGNCIWRVPLEHDGSIGRAGLFIQLSGSLGGPDGIAIDSQGGIAIAHLLLGSVWVFDGQGEPTHRVRSCTGKRVTNVCYGGPDNRTLFITESSTGTILKADVSVPGLSLYSHRSD